MEEPAGLVVPRPALQRRLDAAMGRRLTLVTAPPGSGKTTLLGAWAVTVNTTWCAPGPRDLAGVVAGVVDALRLRVPGLTAEVAATLGIGRGRATDASQAVAVAAAIADALAEHLTRDLVLVLDDLDLRPDSAAERFVGELARQAPGFLHVVVSGRRPPSFPTARLAEAGELVELHGQDFTLGEGEIAAWLGHLVGDTPDIGQLAPQVQAVTGGWPLAVRHVAESLAAVPPGQRATVVETLTVDALAVPELVASAMADEPDATRELVQVLSLLPEASADLLEHLGVSEAADRLDNLVRRGLFVEARPDEPGWFRVRPLVQAQVLAGHGATTDERHHLLRTAAAWYGARGWHGRALKSLRAAADTEAMATYLREHGRTAAERGAGVDVAAALDALDLEAEAWADELRGIVLHLQGDWDGALEHLTLAVEADDVVAAREGWRVGLIHHMRGDIDAADAAYGRSADVLANLPDDVVEPGAVARLHAWWASARWLRGDVEGCRDLAQRAVEEATAVQDDGALAAAHTALAMLAALEGDRPANDAHYLRALEHAERAGDLVQVIRIRTNRGSHHLEEGSVDEAMAELDVALRLAELTGYGAFGAIALTNRGEAQLAMGRLEEARADLERALAEWRRLGSRMQGYALRHLAELDVLRGDVPSARAKFEACVELGRPTGDVQAVVPAAAELARLLAADDPVAAAEFRDLALAHEASVDRARALTAAAEVAVAVGDHDAAGRYADEAESVALRRRDPARAAEAMRLKSLLVDRDEASALLGRASDLLGAVDDPLARARLDLARAAHLDAAEATVLATGVRDRMRALGVGQLDAAASDLLRRLDEDVAELRVETLGGFRLLRQGHQVAVSEWQSRKARDLLKVLVARRGRPVPRDELVETLWPDEASDRLFDRLNVLISTLRGVLDPDRVRPGDHVVVSAEGAVHVNLDHLDVDLEELLEDVTTADRLYRAGRDHEARERDRRAVAAHRGPFLEENAYDDWAVPAREHARAAFLTATRRLARAAAEGADVDTQVRLLLRTLEVDAYDESSHLALVAALRRSGRHGDARRAYQHYAARMDELDVEPAPYPEP